MRHDHCEECDFFGAEVGDEFVVQVFDFALRTCARQHFRPSERRLFVRGEKVRILPMFQGLDAVLAVAAAGRMWRSGFR